MGDATQNWEDVKGWGRAGLAAVSTCAIAPLFIAGYVAGLLYAAIAYGFREAVKDWSP